MSEIATSGLPEVGRSGKGKKFLKWALIALAGILFVILALFAWMAYRMNYTPGDLDFSSTLPSEQGLYQVSYAPQDGSIRVNQIHAWILHVETPDGEPVENAQILVDGDMPQHGHGLPTVPRVTQYLGNGDYRVEGVKFHMPGWWIMEFDITAAGQTDHVTFNLQLSQ